MTRRLIDEVNNRLEEADRYVSMMPKPEEGNDRAFLTDAVLRSLIGTVALLKDAIAEGDRKGGQK